jgi:hypothetical protein
MQSGLLGAQDWRFAVSSVSTTRCALTAAEIGAAFGRDHVVNASLGPGPLGRRLIADAQKLVGFRANTAVERAAAH